MPRRCVETKYAERMGMYKYTLFCVQVMVSIFLEGANVRSRKMLWSKMSMSAPRGNRCLFQASARAKRTH